MSLSDRTTRSIYISIFVAAVLALGYILYVVFFAPAPTPGPTNVNKANNAVSSLPTINGANVNRPPSNVNAPNANAGLPQISSTALGGLTATDVLTPNVSTQNVAAGRDGSVRFYKPDDGKFYRVNDRGVVTALGTAQFPNVETVTWADTSNDVILEFPDGSNVYYNLDNNRQVTLPKEYQEFDFAPSGNQIGFKYMSVDSERRVLAVSQPDGAGATTVESLGIYGDRVAVDWSPTGKVVATVTEFIDANRADVGFIGLNHENFKGTIVEGRGFQSIYSADGEQMLYSVYSAATDYKPGIWIVDADGNDIGNNRRQLGVQTFADKCAFTKDSKTVYCGVPSGQTVGFGLDADVLAGVPDDIVKIDLATGATTRIAIPVDDNGSAIYAVDANSLMLGSDGSNLFFRDRDSGQLVKIKLS